MLDRSGYERHRIGMAKKPKRPRDANQLAKFIVDLASGDIEQKTDDGKNPAAVALGRLGGLRGGKARAEAMTPERRKEVAKLAAKKRWSKKLIIKDKSFY